MPWIAWIAAWVSGVTRNTQSVCRSSTGTARMWSECSWEMATAPTWPISQPTASRRRRICFREMPTSTSSVRWPSEKA